MLIFFVYLHQFRIITTNNTNNEWNETEMCC